MSCQCTMCTLHKEIAILQKKLDEDAFRRFDAAYEAFFAEGFKEAERTSLRLFGAEKALQIISEDFTDETRQRIVKDYLERVAGESNQAKGDDNDAG